MPCNAENSPATSAEAQAFRFAGDFEGTDESRSKEFGEHDAQNLTNVFSLRGWPHFAPQVAASFADAGGEFRLDTKVAVVSWSDETERYSVVTAAGGQQWPRRVEGRPPLNAIHTSSTCRSDLFPRDQFCERYIQVIDSRNEVFPTVFVVLLMLDQNIVFDSHQKSSSHPQKKQIEHHKSKRNKARRSSHSI